MTKKIKGGATVWARQTTESEIFFYKPDKWFKIWFYIVNKVNHKDNKLFRRGEGLITYKEITRATKASKPQVHKCIKYLEKDNMLESRRTTRGMIRIVLNYAYYQDLRNYKDNLKTTTGTTDGQLADNSGVLPIDKNGKNEKNEKKENDFLIFWTANRLRKGKGKAREAFMKVNVPLETLLNALEAQEKERKDLIDRGDFVANRKYPATWLNQRCWEDEAAPVPERGDDFYINEMRKLGPHKFVRKYDVATTNKYLNQYMHE